MVKHCFKTPQLTDEECVNRFGEPMPRWLAERFCAECGKYLTDDIHYREYPPKKEADNEG